MDLDRSASNESQSLRLFGLGVLVFGLLLRLISTQGDLWLDEIWSVILAQDLSSLTNLLSFTASDNNHPINTAWLFALQKFSGNLWLLPEWGVRSLPCLLGMIALLAVARIKTEQRRAQLVFLFFVSLSYPLVLYSSEARGYAFLICSVVLAWSALLHFRASNSHWALVGFWLACVAGLLSHLTFLIFLLAAPLLVLNRATAHRVAKTAVAFMLPYVAALFVVINYLQHIGPGTADLLPRWWLVFSSLSTCFVGIAFSTALPKLTTGLMLAALSFGGIILTELGAEIREGRDDAWFLSAIILLIPVAGILIVQPRVLAERYFLVSIFFSYLVFARWIIRLANSRRIAARVLAGLFVLIFTAGQAYQAGRFVQYFRGNHQALLAWIESQSPQGATLGGDQDYRLGLLLRSYQERGLGKGLSYLAGSSASPVDWYLVENTDAFAQPESELKHLGIIYRLVRVERHAGLSGETLALYSKTSAELVFATSSST